MRIELKTPSAEQVFNALSSLAGKGQNVYVEWTRDAKTRKAFDVTIRKHVRAGVRYGIDYSHVSSVRDAIADGSRDEVGPLPWGQWRSGRVNQIIDHNGKEYVRLAVGTFANMKRTVSWELNGMPSSFEAVKPYLLASEVPKEDDEKPVIMNLHASDITAVGAEAEA